MTVQPVSTFYATFDPVPATSTPPEVMAHAGESFTVVGPVEELIEEAERVYPAYHVKFADGFATVAWTEEISPEVTIDQDFLGRPWRHREAVA